MKRFYLAKLMILVAILSGWSWNAYAQCSPTGTITGTFSVCSGSNTQLVDVATGGTWSSSNTNVASVSPAGLVVGAVSGTTTITYNVSNPCTALATAIVTVNAQPVASTGQTTVCGSLTTLLSNTSAGGTWTSNNLSLATVATASSTSGLVTGVAAGNAVITYTLPGGCFVTTPITVNPLSAITGVPSVCNGLTTTLSDATTGGVWSSSNAGVATIGSGSGVVTSVATGNTTVSYSIAATGCVATIAVAVTAAPTANTVINGGSYCTGGTGVHVGLNSTNAGVSYQLYNGGTAVGSQVIGSGLSLDFGLQTAAGTYAVIADPGTACATTQTGSVTVTVIPLPTAFTVSATGGGAYCSGSTVPHIFLSSSVIGTNYQLFNGSLPVTSVSGTGASLDFGPMSTTGTYTVTANNTLTGCSGPMSGSAVITVNPLPALNTVTITNGGGYCFGTTSNVHVGLNGSAIGNTYQLYYNGSLSGTSQAGTGAALDFGAQSAAGVYTVIATTAAGCTATMNSSGTLVVNTIPAVFTVTGGGSYCAGTATVHVGLNASVTGISYQLYSSGTTFGLPLAGTGLPLDFGALPAGSYTVSASNGTTGCTVNMSGSASITVNPLPAPFTVSGGGGYCTGSTAPHITLSSSAVGVNYTLLNGATVVGSAPGTTSILDFGSQAATGAYTVTALNTTTNCVNTMTGTVTVTMNPLPVAFSVTGGGSYCLGGTGVAVGLANSVAGRNYQLFVNGISTGAPVAGTGAAISFGLQTTTGAYTAVATNTSTLCSSNMTGSVLVSTTSLPVIYTVTGGGGYCPTSAGAHVGLSASDLGINYQLMRAGTTPVGTPISGTGGAIDFGAQNTIGTYTVVATNAATFCTSNMFGSVNVFIHTLAVTYALTTTGGAYCLGGAGVPVSLANSQTTVNYQLYNGSVAVGGPVAGNGGLLNFGNQTAAGNYTVVATNTINGCSNNMTGTAAVTVNPLPAVFNITSAGTSYCTGTTGVQIGLNGSASGFSYQLYNSGTISGVAVAGTGGVLTFGLHTAGVYTVVATNSATFCTNNMTGSITVTANPLPAIYTVSGGGAYCFGSGGVPVNLSGSNAGINYQLFAAGSSAGVPLAGTGSALSFGSQTAAGAYTVTATNTITGCTSSMTGIVAVTINPLPVTRTIMGGGSFCPGGSGVDISLNNSANLTTISYQLYDGTVAEGAAMPGTGTAIDFGLQTATGTYTVIATNTLTSCAATMSGSATVSLLPLPLTYSVTGGGNYCPSGSGVNVGLSGSNSGISYQLYNNNLGVIGVPVAGTGLPMAFGQQTDTGTYTVVAINSATSCTNNMSGSVAVMLNSVPNAYNVTGGGSYCSGAAGLHVGIDGSDTGNKYQLYKGISAIDAPVAGSGAALDFGLQTASGTYTVLAISNSTTCNNIMAGSVTITVNPLPVAYTVSGGGAYCAGTGGVHVGLLSSAADTNIRYQLFNGVASVGSPVAGNGFALDFGTQTAAGAYTVVATNTLTNCTENMFGNAVVTVNVLPAAYTVTGGGNYCFGGTGLHVGINGSGAGITYQLHNGASFIGAPVAGTGSPIDFGLQTAAGNYTVVASNTATSCINAMSDTVTIGINPLPNVYTISSSASEYCAGTSGVSLVLSGSDSDVSYQLSAGGTTLGSPLPGTGFELNFGLQTAAGAYTVVAVNTITGCTANMASSAFIVINPLPTAFSVVGGGAYCFGGTGVHIGLAGSHNGLSYQLYNNGIPAGSAIPGTGAALDFGSQTAAGAYTVIATNPVTTCENTMAGGALVEINTLPGSFTVTGGGNYCAAGSGVHVGLAGSNTGITYQLYDNGSSAGAPATGTGLSLDFGLQTAIGTYTIVAMNTATGCTTTMAGTTLVNTTPVPASYSVTGGGQFCVGASGDHVGLSNSDAGINYQLYNGTLAMGAPLAGTGAALDYGLQTTAGAYTVVAVNATTECSSNMSGSASVIINALPVSYSVIGGGTYCIPGPGVHVGLNSSATGASYQLFNGSAAAGTLVTGTGGPLDFGLQAATGNYTVVATNVATGCSSTMAGVAAITAGTSVTPFVSLSVADGDTACSGTPVTVNAAVVNGGSSPAYSWSVNGVPMVGITGSFTYSPSAGDVVGLSVTSNAACASPAMASSSLPLTVLASAMPSVTVSSDHGNTVCQGTSVTFTLSTAFGGSAPAISWIVDGIDHGTATDYTYTPLNGDVVSAVLTSNYHCRLATTVPGNNIVMEVDAPVTPAVVVTADPGTSVQQGQTLLLAAAVTNAVIAPSYQWLLNGAPVAGATASSYTTTTFANLDSFTCMVVSGGGCSGFAGANSVVIHTTNVGVQQVTSAGSDIKLVPNPNKGAFTIKGSIGATGDEEVSIEVSDMLGQVIYQDKVIAHSGNIDQKIQLSNILANGMYILNLRSASANDVFHVVIEQ